MRDASTVQRLSVLAAVVLVLSGWIAACGDDDDGGAGTGGAGTGGTGGGVEEDSSTAGTGGTGGGEEDSGAGGSGGAGEDGALPGMVDLEGVVRRSVDPAAGGDGVGTLCFSVVDFCPTPDDLSAPTVILDGLSVADADLGAAGAEVPFDFEVPVSDLPDGAYALFAVLREAGGQCAGDPAAGDLVSITLLGGSSCPELTVSGAGSITGLEVYLNGIVP